MTLLELSVQYADGAAAIHTRIRELEQLEQLQTDPVCAQALRRRILELTPLWRDMREMTRRTAHYYDRRWQIAPLIPAAVNGWAI